MKKRLLALLVACAMIVSLLPVQVLAFDGADASVQTQAEETESSASAQEQEEAEPEESEPEEEPEAEESEPEESEAQEPAAEESQEDESRAEEPEADKSEEDESQKAEPAAEESQPEDAGAGLVSQDGDNPLVEENPLEAYCAEHEIYIDEVGEISRFATDRCDVDPGEYAQVDCWPEKNNLTITVDKQEFRLSTYDGDMQAMGNAIHDKLVADGVPLEDEVHLYWRSEENEDHPWRAGMHEAEIVLDYQGWEMTQPYNVRVLELESIDTPDLTRSIYFRRFRDDNDDQHPNNGKLDCWPESFTVTLIEGYDDENRPDTREFSLDKDGDYGESYWDALWEAYPYLRHFDVDWRSDENPGTMLQAGDTIHAKLFMYAYYDPDTQTGYYTDYDVTLTDPNPFVSVSVTPFYVFETQTEVMREGADENHDQPWEWTRLWCDPNLDNSVTATIRLRNEDGNFTDQTATVTGTRDEVQRKLKDDYDLNLDIWWNSEETPEANWENQHWTVNDHPTIQCDLTAHLWDEDCDIPLCDYEVTVLSTENFPIKRVYVPAISRLTTDRHEMREYIPDEDRDIEWQRVDCYPEQVSVWYGTEEGDPTFTGDLNEVRDQIQQRFSQDFPGVSFDMDWYSEETAIKNEDGQWVGSWEGPDLYTACLRVNGVSYEYNVQLVDPDSLFESVTVDDFSRFENDRCDPESFWDENDQEHQWRRLNCDINDEHVVVKLADGKTFDTDERDENDRNRRKYDNLDDMRWNIEQHLRKEYPGLRVDWDWRSDEQPEEENGEWVGSYRAGGTYDVHAFFGGKRADFQVKVKAPLDLSIDEVGQVNRLNSDRHWCDGKQGEDNEEHGFERINCHPGFVKLTVNGTPREGDFSELMDQLAQENEDTRLPWYWDSDEIPVQNEDGDWVGSWGVGVHKATLTIGEAEKDYEVRVIAPDELFRSVEVSDITRLTTDRNRTDWWENDQRIEWKQVDCYPNYVKMTTSDGTEFVYDNERDGSDPVNRVYDDYEEMCDAVQKHLRSNGYSGLDLDLGWDSSEHPLSNEDGAMGDWTAGEQYDAWIDVNGEDFAGDMGHYNVRVVDPEDLFASVTVENISRFENDRCDPESGRDKDGNEIQWRRLDCGINDEHVIVTLKDGTTFDTDDRYEDNEDERRYNNLSHMCWHIEQHLRKNYPGIRVNWDWYSDEEPEYEDDEWVGTFRAGNTYDVHGVVGGMDTTFQVEVKQALVLSIDQVDPVYRLTNDRDWCWKEGNDGAEHGFDRINCHPALVKLTVNNMEYAGDFSTVMDNIAKDNGGTRLPWGWDSNEIPEQNGDEWVGSWSVGEHEATLTVGGVSRNYEVHVIAPSKLFQSVEVRDVKRLETDRYQEDWWENDQRFDWQRLDCTPDYVKMVTSDGTEFVYDNELEDSDPVNRKYHELRYLFDDVREHLRRRGAFPGLNLELFWYSSERPLSNEGGTPGDWTANDQQNHEAWICVRGGEEIAPDMGHYNVTLLPNPVASADIPDVTVDAENRRQDGAKELMCPPTNGKITLHLTDGRTVTGYFRSEGNMDLQRRLEEAVGEDYDGLFDFHWYSDDFEEEQNRWQHGTHEAMMTINGRPFFYKVHVTNDGHKEKTLLDEGLSFHAAVDATCTAPGKIAYWVCQECQKLFKDRNLTEEITEEQIETPAKGHTLTAVAEKAATCTAPGNIAYWTCKECGKYFKDAQGTQEITQQQTVKPAKGHTLTHVARKEAKVGAAGNIEYWTCKVCKKYFKDAKGTQEITQAKTVIPALKRITLVNTDVKVAAGTYVYNGKAQSPTVTVTHGGKTLTRNKDYSLSYANNVKAGTATVTVTGTGDYQGTVTRTFAIAKAKGKITASNLVVTASQKKSYSLGVSANCKVKYTGGSKDVKVDAKTGKITVSKANTYYKATITISGNDANYSVSKKNITVMIGPGVPTLKTAKTGKDAKTVDLIWAKMTKDKKGVNAFEIQCALDKKFTKSVKTQKVNKAAAVNATVKGLTSQKMYYFRIRAVAGKFYSRWSTVKTAKAK